MTGQLPRHVLEEVERDLPRRAVATDDIDLAYHRLRTLYLARARIVDVPPDWSASDPRVQAITLRRATDAPAARLAVSGPTQGPRKRGHSNQG